MSNPICRLACITTLAVLCVVIPMTRSADPVSTNAQWQKTVDKAVGYLKTTPSPTRQELAHGISGNLCRCQDYDKILTAMMRGAEIMRGV